MRENEQDTRTFRRFLKRMHRVLASAERRRTALGFLQRLPAAFVTCWFLSSFAGASPQVVISEIHYHPPDDPAERLEFLELHNPSGGAVDITRWSLRKGVRFQFDPARGPTRIAPRGYLVIARDPRALERRYRLENEIVAGPYEGKLSNSGERLELLDADAVLVDAVEYRQDGLWPARADGLGSSLQRVALHDPGHLPQNWKVDFDEKADGTSVELIGEGSRLRWFVSPRGEEPGFSDPHSWVDAYFDDSDERWRDGVLPVGCDTKGKSRLSWIRTEGPGAPGLHSLWMRVPFEVDEETASGARPRLHADWDDGLIAWLNGVEIARDGMFDPPGTAPPGPSVYRARTLSAGGDRRPAPHYREIWRGRAGLLRTGRNVLALGNYNSSMRSSDLACAARLLVLPAESSRAVTPGRENSTAAASLPPLIARVEREPRQPAPEDRVTIRARVRGNAAAVTLFYDLGAGEVAVNMMGERTHEDAVGRVFTASIPAAPARTVVRFRLRSANSEGVSISHPRGGNPTKYEAYLVCRDPPAENPDLEVYHLFWEGELSCASGRWTSGATFVHRGTAHVNVRLKHRGQTSCSNPKRGLRVAFRRGDLFRGQRRLNLLAGFEDRSLLREVLAWGLFRDMGHAYCDARLAAVYGLDNEFLGLYVALESLSKDYLRRNGLDGGGTLWKCNNYLREGSAEAFEPVTGGGQEEWRYLLDFGRRTNELRGPDLIDYLESNVDIESFLDYQAVKCVISDEDGFRKNWLLHHSVTHGDGGAEKHTWTVLPWDLDLSFGQIDLHDERRHVDKHPLMGTRDHPRYGNRWNGLIEAVLGRRAGDHFIKALYGRIWSLLQEEFRPDVLLARIDRLDRHSIDAARADLARWPRWGREPGNPDVHRQDVRDYVIKRHLFLRSFLSASQVTVRNEAAGTGAGAGSSPGLAAWRRFRYEPAPRMKITEIHFHPDRGDELEFLEVYNLEKKAVDVSGWNIPSVGFVFPQGSRVFGESCFLIARNPERLRSSHPQLSAVPVFGPTPGRLSNTGEVVRLRDDGRHHGKTYYPETIDAVRYSSRAPWPLAAGGGGRSLELRGLSLDNDRPESWRASGEIGGSPGRVPRT